MGSKFEIAQLWENKAELWTYRIRAQAGNMQVSWTGMSYRLSEDGADMP